MNKSTSLREKISHLPIIAGAYWRKWFVLPRRYRLMAYQKNRIFDPHTDKRAKIWKKCGVDVQGRFNVGFDVYFDAGNAERIHIEEGVWIAARTLFLCHKRDLSQYCVGDDYNRTGYKFGDIYLKKGCCVGMGSIVMPGVTIGEGAVVGAGSLVIKDVPPYSVVSGNPAKVLKVFPERAENKQITPPVSSRE